MYRFQITKIEVFRRGTDFDHAEAGAATPNRGFAHQQPPFFDRAEPVGMISTQRACTAGLSEEMVQAMLANETSASLSLPLGRNVKAVFGALRCTPARMASRCPSTVAPARMRQPLAQFPADGDNDLVVVKGTNGIAKGEILLLGGRVMDLSGRPLTDTKVEIWQCNAFGRYHHSRDSSPAPIDPAFQGWGQSVTGDDGEYRFRTIKPVPYPGRTPHIHFLVTTPKRVQLVTQMYLPGEPGNARDGVFLSLEASQRAAVLVRLDKAPDGKALAGRFDIVLGAGA